jgi:hypothetical protein
MTAIKTRDGGVALAGAQYHVQSANDNHIILRQLPGSANIRLGSASIYVDLTQANIADLLPALTAFSLTGVLS